MNPTPGTFSDLLGFTEKNVTSDVPLWPLLPVHMNVPTWPSRNLEFITAGNVKQLTALEERTNQNCFTELEALMFQNRHWSVLICLQRQIL